MRISPVIKQEKREVRDSNPGAGLPDFWFSRPTQSTSLPTPQKLFFKLYNIIYIENINMNGADRIRTCIAFLLERLANSSDTITAQLQYKLNTFLFPTHKTILASTCIHKDMRGCCPRKYI